MSRWPRFKTPASDIGRFRFALLLIVVADLAIKLWIASTTFGTSDVATWMRFGNDVARVGPVDIYKVYYVNAQHAALYNHPPLVGYLLILVNSLTHLGFSFPFAIRLPSILADTITPFLVLELLRQRLPLRRSFEASAWVAASPILVMVSGFHGNTDPVFVMLCLLSLYLLVERRMPSLAGVAIAAAVSIKIVPAVVLPTLALFALFEGRRVLTRFVLGFGGAVAAIWGPAMARASTALVHDVFGYSGSPSFRVWGLVQLGHWGGVRPLTVWLPGPGRFVVALAASLIPASMMLWHRDRVVEATALALCLFFVLAPAFAPQYLAWVVAPAYLISIWSATLYNLLAGGFLLELYHRKASGTVHQLGRGHPFTNSEIAMAMVVWVALVAVVAEGVRTVLRAPSESINPGNGGSPPE